MTLREDPLVVVARLAEALRLRSDSILRYERYYRGEHDLPYTPNTSTQREYRRLLSQSVANWCSTVVETTAERMYVDGFRVGDDPDADSSAWDLWKASRFDAKADLVLTEAVATGYAAVMVDPQGRMSAESPLEVIVEYEPGSEARYAALKLWYDLREKVAYATLYDSDFAYRYAAPASQWTVDIQRSMRWEPRADGAVIHHGMGDVPVVELRNRPTMAGVGRSELQSVTPLQDSANSLMFDLLMTGHYAAFAQKWVTGMEIPTNPDTGEPVEPFEAAVDRLWVAESPDTKFGSFDISDLSNFVRAIEMIVQNIASITQVPPHYLLSISGTLPSSESLRAAEAGLIAKVRRRSAFFGDAFEDVIRLALRATGDERADLPIETLWRDPEFHSPGVLADATVKLVQAKVIPVKQAWIDLGYTAQEMERMAQWLDEDRLLGLTT